MAKIKRLASKEYRDVYLSSRVRAAIALQVRALRRRMNKSQKEFAKLIGTTQSGISDLENPDGEHVAVQTLLNIASALDVALIVRFAGYSEFIRLMGDMSPQGLAAETIHETVATEKQKMSSKVPVLVNITTGGSANTAVGSSEAAPRLAQFAFSDQFTPARVTAISIGGGHG